MRHGKSGLYRSIIFPRGEIFPLFLSFPSERIIGSSNLAKIERQKAGSINPHFAYSSFTFAEAMRSMNDRKGKREHQTTHLKINFLVFIVMLGLVIM